MAGFDGQVRFRKPGCKEGSWCGFFKGLEGVLVGNSAKTESVSLLQPRAGADRRRVLPQGVASGLGLLAGRSFSGPASFPGLPDPAGSHTQGWFPGNFLLPQSMSCGASLSVPCPRLLREGALKLREGPEDPAALEFGRLLWFPRLQSPLAE